MKITGMKKTTVAAIAAAAVLVPLAPVMSPSAHADGICKRGVVALGPTSCPFALDVASAYYANIGSGPGELYNVYSPTTGENYNMSCSTLGAGVMCTGGNGAEVNIF